MALRFLSYRREQHRVLDFDETGAGARTVRFVGGKRVQQLATELADILAAETFDDALDCVAPFFPLVGRWRCQPAVGDGKHTDVDGVDPVRGKQRRQLRPNTVVGALASGFRGGGKELLGKLEGVST